MNYKTYLKNNDVILIKLRIIKHRVVDKLQVNEIAQHYSMHRNSVRNVMTLYDSKAPLTLKEKIIKNLNISSSDISQLCQFLLPVSRKPKSHPKQANTEEEKRVQDYFETLKVGAKRLCLILRRKKEL